MRGISVNSWRYFRILTAWPLASYSGHFCLILANSMLTCLLITAMGFPPEQATTDKTDSETAYTWTTSPSIGGQMQLQNLHNVALLKRWPQIMWYWEHSACFYSSQVIIQRSAGRLSMWSKTYKTFCPPYHATGDLRFKWCSDSTWLVLVSIWV